MRIIFEYTSPFTGCIIKGQVAAYSLIRNGDKEKNSIISTCGVSYEIDENLKIIEKEHVTKKKDSE